MTNEIQESKVELSLNDKFVEHKLKQDKYRIELGNSWLYCMVFKPVGRAHDDDVDILYLDSFYESDIHWKKLMLYAGLIAERLNGKKPFDKIEFSKPM